MIDIHYGLSCYKEAPTDGTDDTDKKTEIENLNGQNQHMYEAGAWESFAPSKPHV